MTIQLVTGGRVLDRQDRWAIRTNRPKSPVWQRPAQFDPEKAFTPRGDAQFPPPSPSTYLGCLCVGFSRSGSEHARLVKRHDVALGAGNVRACFKSSKRFLEHVETDAAYERELVVP